MNRRETEARGGEDSVNARGWEKMADDWMVTVFCWATADAPSTLGNLARAQVCGRRNATRQPHRPDEHVNMFCMCSDRSSQL
jgi:hypothetical protein